MQSNHPTISPDRELRQGGCLVGTVVDPHGRLPLWLLRMSCRPSTTNHAEHAANNTSITPPWGSS